MAHMEQDAVELRALALPDVDRRLVTWSRRAVSIGAVTLLFVAVLALTVVWLPLAAIVDLASGGRRCSVRCGVFLVYYLGCELVGIAASALLWVEAAIAGRGFTSSAYLRRNFALQRRWSGWLLHGAQRIFDVRFEVEGGEALEGGPMILMLRHASIADTLLASEFVSRPFGIHLRYVLKRELLWDPCLDIVGQRLPNYFVRRDSEDTDREVRGVRALATGLGQREGVLIYPEGTRFSAAKRERVLTRLRAGGHSELAQRAERLLHTLPPRPGGTLGLLDANPGLDVVFGAHVGLEPVASPKQLWNGAIRGQTIRLRFWRIAADDVPSSRPARLDWLFEQWQRIDDWIGDVRSQSGESDEGGGGA